MRPTTPGDRPKKGRDELASLNEDLRRTNYMAQLVLAQQAWREVQIDQVREHLQVAEPRRPGDPDLRGFEWYYLLRLCDASARTLRGHNGRVFGLAFSPDGRRLVSAGSDDRTFKIWDVNSGQLIRSQLGWSDGLICVAYSPDGRRIATGGGSDNNVQLWEADSGSLMRHPARARRRGYDRWRSAPTVTTWPPPRGRDDQALGARTGREVGTLRGHSRAINRLVYSPDGQRLASASHDGTVKLWDAASGALVRTLNAHGSGAWGVAFSPDGRRLASCGSDATVRLWDAVSGQELLALSGHAGPVHTVAYSSDGRRVASSSVDGTVRLWDCQLGSEHYRP